jgi:hypothetical protein
MPAVPIGKLRTPPEPIAPPAGSPATAPTPPEPASLSRVPSVPPFRRSGPCGTPRSPRKRAAPSRQTPDAAACKVRCPSYSCLSLVQAIPCRCDMAISAISVRGYFGRADKIPRMEGTASGFRTLLLTLNYPRSGIIRGTGHLHRAPGVESWLGQRQLWLADCIADCIYVQRLRF